MKKIRVLLCGTVFGQIYLRGVLKNEAYEIKGILSKGSEKSKEIANTYGLTIHTDIEEIKSEDYDLALVVVRSGIIGGKGNTIALSLVNKGISVIQEQPVHADEATQLFKAAVKNNVDYSVNTFYSSLPSSRVFHKKLNKLKEKEEIKSIDGSCSIPVLLPFIDQVCRIAGGVHPYVIDDNKIIQTSRKTVMGIKICGIECILSINGTLKKADIEDSAYLLNSMDVMFKSGNLMLTEVNGQVVFIPRPYIVEEYLKQGKADAKQDKIATELLCDYSGKRFTELYAKEWPEAVCNYLSEKEEEIRAKKCDISEMQYYMGLCELWKDISDRIGR